MPSGRVETPEYAGMTPEEKQRAYIKKSYEKHKEKRQAYGRAQSKRYREENREVVLLKKLNQWLVLNFKRDSEWYEKTLEEQKGHCALCDAVPNGRRLQVDHDHACCPTSRGGRRRTCGECVRGLLCENCNTDLGRLENWLKQGTIAPLPDTWLDRALRYLLSFERTQQCNS